MKTKDCYYYSKKINIGKKYETRNSIFGFSFSLILFSILLIFGSFIYYIESSINKNHNLSSIKINLNSYENSFLDNNIDNIEETIFYKNYGISFNITKEGFLIKDVNYPTIILDDKEIKYKDTYKYNNEEVKILNQSILSFNNDKLYLESEEKYLIDNNYGKVILAGNSLTGKENEIMVSSNILNYCGVTDYNAVIGKKISFYNQLFFGNVSYGYESNGNYVDETEKVKNQNYYVFKDFIIVGVFNSNIYFCPSRLTNNNTDWPEYIIKNNPNFWLNSNSILEYNYNYYSYIDTDNKLHMNQNKLCFTYNLLDKLNENTNKVQILANSGNNLKINDITNIIQFKSLKLAYNSMSIFNNDFTLNNQITYSTNSDLYSYFVFYPYFEFVKSIIIVITTIIILLVILNIFRVMDYSLNINKKYFMMMSYLGLEKKDIKKIYYFKNISDYIKSILISFIILLPLCIIISILLNKLYITQFRGMLDFNIPFYYYLISIIIPIIIIFTIVNIISIIIFNNYFSSDKRRNY